MTGAVHAVDERLPAPKHSGILLAAFAAAVLNVFFDVLRPAERPREEVVLPPPAGIAGAHLH